MRAADADILIIPGWSGSEEDHWQSRWERSLTTARRVVQEEWYEPDLGAWTARIKSLVQEAQRPVVLVAHSLGVIAAVHAAPLLTDENVAGAFLVAPADVDNADKWPVTRGYDPCKSIRGFAPTPTARLPFPAMLVASANDPYCTLERAKELAEAWGATLVESGDCGHLNVDSGHGPWPDGLLRFGLFMKTLG
jgi:serine hydrolase